MKTYEELRKINVNEKVEKRGNFSYLSWAWAVDTLLLEDPTATWTYSEPRQWGETWMVFCTVNMNSNSRTAQLPVMDNRNKAIPNPDAFQINTAMQRCLAKAISLHGIGLYIYAGEDLPDGAEPPTDDEKRPTGHDKVDGDKTVGQVIEANNAMEQIESPDMRVAIRDAAKAIEKAFYEQSAKAGVQLWRDERATMNEAEVDALWGALNATVRNNLKKCEDAMRVAA